MASSASIASQLLGTPNHGAAGSTNTPQNTGRGQASGVRMAPGGPSSRGPSASTVAQTVMPAPRAPKAPVPRGGQQAPSRAPQFSASNPMLGTPAPLPPHPGVMPPFPDARSPAITLTPPGLPIMPPPAGFPLAGMIPRVPQSFAHSTVPAETPQMATPHAMRLPLPRGAPQTTPTAPPTMPPIAQSHMPMTAHAMQIPHLPPGGAAMPQRAGQTPQIMRRPGMSGLLGR